MLPDRPCHETHGPWHRLKMMQTMGRSDGRQLLESRACGTAGHDMACLISPNQTKPGDCPAECKVLQPIKRIPFFHTPKTCKVLDTLPCASSAEFRTNHCILALFGPSLGAHCHKCNISLELVLNPRRLAKNAIKADAATNS